MVSETKEITTREELIFELLIFILYDVNYNDEIDEIISKYREAWEELPFNYEVQD